MDLQYILLTSHRPQYLLPSIKTTTKQQNKEHVAQSSIYRLTSNYLRSHTHQKHDVLRKTTTIQQPLNQHNSNIIGNYSLGKEIGKGGFAKVYQATNIHTGRKYAIKEYLLQDAHQCFMNESYLGKILSEKEINEGYDYLIGFIERIRIGKKGYIVQELGGNSLSKMIYDIQGVFHENERIQFKDFYRQLTKGNNLKKMLLQICRGVKLLNECGFIHCDLKSQNILVKNENEEITVKVIDFGSTFQVSKGIPKITITPEYMSPQLLTLLNIDAKSTHQHLDKVDVWSIGCIILEIVTGLPLWFKYKCKLNIKGKVSLQLGYFSLANRDFTKIIKKQREISQNIGNSNKIVFTFDEFQKYRPILKKCLEFNSQRRLSIGQLTQQLQNI